MKQIAHKLSFYMDGNVKVEFCSVCGKEGSWDLMIADCPEYYKLDEAKKVQEAIDKLNKKA